MTACHYGSQATDHRLKPLQPTKQAHFSCYLGHFGPSLWHQIEYFEHPGQFPVVSVPTKADILSELPAKFQAVYGWKSFKAKGFGFFFYTSWTVVSQHELDSETV